MRLFPSRLARRSTVWLALALGGCDGYSAAEKADTIETWEAWIAEHPDNEKVLLAETRLEQLFLERARAEESLEAYDAYIARFPDGAHYDEAMAEREDKLWAWARETNTVEGWGRYLADYPRGHKEWRKEAQQMIEVLEYLDHLEISPVQTERINLGGDPGGPLNGWAIRVDVKNTGEKKVSKLVLELTYELPTRSAPVVKLWPVVSPTWSVPLPEHQRRTLLPGDTRLWEWATSDPPEDWDGTATVRPVLIDFDEV